MVRKTNVKRHTRRTKKKVSIVRKHKRKRPRKSYGVGGGFGDIIGEKKRRADRQRDIEKLTAKLRRIKDPIKQEVLLKKIRLLKKRRDA